MVEPEGRVLILELWDEAIDVHDRSASTDASATVGRGKRNQCVWISNLAIS